MRLLRTLGLSLVVALALLGGSFSLDRPPSAAGQSQQVDRFSANLTRQLADIYLQKQSLTTIERKIDSRVLQTVREARRRVSASATGARPSLRGLSNALLKVDDPGNIEIKLLLAGVTEARLQQLKTMGIQVRLSLPEYRVVEGSLSYDKIEAVAALDFITNVGTPGYAYHNTGAINSEGDNVTGASQARSTFSVNGTGIKVGVMSDGVTHLTDSQASADLPAVQVLQAGTGDEGTAMLEIINDLAPGSPLAFYSPSTSSDMVAGIRALRDAGSKVIVDDLTFLDEPKFEDGPIALEARAFYTGGGIYVTSAGNSGQRHYMHGYIRTPAPGGGPGGLYPYAHNYGGTDIGNTLTVANGQTIITILQWNNRVGQSADDLDLFLVRESDGAILAYSNGPQDGNDTPWEGLLWQNTTGGSLNVYVGVFEYSLVSPPSSLTLDYSVYYGSTLQYSVPENSVIGHAAVMEVLSTAATYWGTPTVIESFSSRGPGTILFPTAQDRQVPNIAGVDGVHTRTGQLGYFVDPFYGTSAAAPHVAAVAALLWQAKPAATAAEIRNTLLSTSVDLGPAGWDGTWGYGRVDAYPAIATPSVVTGNATSIDATFASLNGTLSYLPPLSSVNVTFQWGTAPGSLPNETANQTMNTTGPFTADLTGLSANTTYYFRARAVGLGTSYGGTANFTTLATTPPAVTTENATSISYFSAQLSGNLTGLGSATSVNVSFQWGTAPGNLSNETANQTMNGTSLFSANLTSLSANSTYYFKAKAMGLGTSYGGTANFTTLATTPPFVIATPVVPAYYSATLGGLLSDLGTATSVNVSFRWGLSSDNLSVETAAQTMNATGNFNSLVTGLSPNTTYYWRAEGVGLGGHGTAYSSTANFTTLATTPPGVTTENATSINFTSAQMNGNLTDLGTATSVNVSFRYGITPGNLTNQFTSWAMNATGPFGGHLIGLSANTTYYYRATATGHGSSNGTELSFTTLPTTPPSVTTQNATSVNLTSAVLNGNLTSLGTGTSANVSFRWGTAPGSLTNETTSQNMSGTGTFNFTLGTLSPNTTYYFQAKAVGLSTEYTYPVNHGTALGSIENFTTLSTPPGVTTENATNISYFSAQVSGNLTDLGTATSANVYFQWGASPGSYTANTTAQTVNTTGLFSANLTGLSANTAYYYRAVATAHGTDYGDEKSFTTLPTTAPTVIVGPVNLHYFDVVIYSSLTDLGTATSVNVSFQWGPSSDNLSVETAAQTMNASGEFSANVTGLSANTTYYWRARGVGLGGHGTGV